MPVLQPNPRSSLEEHLRRLISAERQISQTCQRYQRQQMENPLLCAHTEDSCARTAIGGTNRNAVRLCRISLELPNNPMTSQTRNALRSSFASYTRGMWDTTSHRQQHHKSESMICPGLKSAGTRTPAATRPTPKRVPAVLPATERNDAENVYRNQISEQKEGNNVWVNFKVFSPYKLTSRSMLLQGRTCVDPQQQPSAKKSLFAGGRRGRNQRAFMSVPRGTKCFF